MVEGTQSPAEQTMNGMKTRPSLLLRVRDFRDQKSWDEFVELYGPLVLRYLRRIGVAQQEALDLLQDILEIVVRHIGSFEYDPGKSFRAWLRTIATHRAYRYFRTKKRQPITPGGTTHVQAMHETPNKDDGQGENDWIEQEWRKRRLELALEKSPGPSHGANLAGLPTALRPVSLGKRDRRAVGHGDRSRVYESIAGLEGSRGRGGD